MANSDRELKEQLMEVANRPLTPPSLIDENLPLLDQIHALVMSLNFTGIEIKTINSLESWNGGVLVMVLGSVKTKDFSGRRKFGQTFFLAPQEKGYFVLNDIFQFIDEESIHQHPASTLSENIIDSQLDASSSLLKPPAAEDDPVDKYSLPEQQQQQDPEAETVVEETPVEESASLQSVLNTVQDPLPAPVEEPVGEPPKQTYASILRGGSKGHTASPFVPESGVEGAEEGLALEEEGESRSVYGRNLSSTVSDVDIEQEFQEFSRIKTEGVFIGDRQESGVCYAFVEFEDTIGVQHAVKEEE